MFVFSTVILSLLFRRAFYPPEERQPIDYVVVAFCTFVLAVIFDSLFP